MLYQGDSSRDFGDGHPCRLTKDHRESQTISGLFPRNGYGKKPHKLTLNLFLGYTPRKNAKGELPRQLTLTKINNRSSESSEEKTVYSRQQFKYILAKIKGMRLRWKTRRMYHARWLAFNKFIQKFDIMPDTWEERLHLYAAYLIDNKKQSSTVRTYLTAIKQILRLADIEINEEKYLLSSMIKACKIKNDRLYIRMPIQLSLLKALLRKAHQYYLLERGQVYLATMLKAMFAMAYFGLMRVSEITTGAHPVKAPDVRYAKNKNKIVVTLHSSKTHSYKDNPQHITIEGQPDLHDLCPVKLIADYVKLRGNLAINETDAFFVYQDNVPVTPSQFRACLKKLLRKIPVDISLYDTHGFRAGRVVDLVKLGFSISRVKALGHWLSDSIMVYLKF